MLHILAMALLVPATNHKEIDRIGPIYEWIRTAPHLNDYDRGKEYDHLRIKSAANAALYPTRYVSPWQNPRGYC